MEKKYLFSIIPEEDTKAETPRLFSVIPEEDTKAETSRLFSVIPEEDTKAETPRLFSVIPEEQKVENTEEKVKNNGVYKEVPKRVDREVLSLENFEIGESAPEHVSVFSGQSMLPSNINQCIQAVDQKPVQTLQTNEKRGFDFQSVRFSYSEGSLYALGAGKNAKYLGNFCLNLHEEIKHEKEVLNEANECIKNIVTTLWKFEIIILNSTYITYVREADLLGLFWIREASCYRAVYEDTAESKRILRLYVQKIISAEQHNVITEFATPGWKFNQDNTPYYVTSNGVIGFPNLPIRAINGFSLLISGNKDQHKIIHDFLYMRQIISGNLGNAVYLQHYVMTSLMTSFFKKTGHQIEFTTALIGKTNSKKTSCAEIFARIFGRTKSAVPDINFSATEASIYEIMGKGADQIVLVDDLTPSENDGDAKMKQRKVELIIRSYGDRVPRRRSVSYASNDNATEFVPITGCALLTGEEFSCGKSSRARVIILRFEEGDVDDKELTYFQNNLYILPDFVNLFIQYLAKYFVEIIDIIPQECAYARNYLKKQIKTTRYRDAYGVLCATSRIFNDFLRRSNIVSCEEAQAMLMSDRELMLQIILQNDGEVSMIAPGIIVIEALGDAIDKKVVQVESLDQWQEDKYKNKVLIDDTYMYVQLETLFECTRRYTDYRKIHFPYTSGRKIAELLNAENLLLVKKEGNEIRRAHKLVIDGKLVNRRFVYLLRKKIEEIWKNGEEL